MKFSSMIISAHLAACEGSLSSALRWPHRSAGERQSQTAARVIS